MKNPTFHKNSFLLLCGILSCVKSQRCLPWMNINYRLLGPKVPSKGRKFLLVKYFGKIFGNSPHLSRGVGIELDCEESLLGLLHGLHLLRVVALTDGPAVVGGLTEDPVEGHCGVAGPGSGDGCRYQI